MPSTNPIATVYFKVLCALMTRNAIVISPHPAARACCVDATRTLAEAAVEAGAPDGAVQVLEEISLPLVDEFMKSDRTDVILATGGAPMVRAAYSSSNPAIGVGPGNAPVYVDESADLKNRRRPHRGQQVVRQLGAVYQRVGPDHGGERRLEAAARAFTGRGASVRRDADRGAAALPVPRPGLHVEALGRDAAWIAEQAGFKAPARTRILVTPIRLIGDGEELSREKLCRCWVFSWRAATTRR